MSDIVDPGVNYLNNLSEQLIKLKKNQARNKNKTQVKKNKNSKCVSFLRISSIRTSSG